MNELAPSFDTPAGEVDADRERYSAARYIDHLRDALHRGNAKGRPDWLKYINRLSPDDYLSFMLESDALIEQGALVHVLTAEEQEQVKARVIEKRAEYMAMGGGFMKDFGISPEEMHRQLYEIDHEDDGLINASPFFELPENDNAWPEDEEDVDIGGETDDRNE